MNKLPSHVKKDSLYTPSRTTGLIARPRCASRSIEANRNAPSKSHKLTDEILSRTAGHSRAAINCTLHFARHRHASLFMRLTEAASRRSAKESAANGWRWLRRSRDFPTLGADGAHGCAGFATLKVTSLATGGGGGGKDDRHRTRKKTPFALLPRRELFKWITAATPWQSFPGDSLIRS